MLNAIFQPVVKWPGAARESSEQCKSPFRATYQQTLDLLEAELGYLGAQNIVIQCFFTRDQLRNDGWPKGGQNPSKPGVILSFTLHGEAYSYPCDTYNWWSVNLRAIALALEALRKVDRYGVTGHGEQYAGFKQIPSGGPPPREKMTPREAAAFISGIFPGVSPDVLLTGKSWFEMALREARKLAHPDAGGSHGQFVKLQEAGDVLTKHFARTAAAGGDV
jgi:hypothetical protein